MNCFLDGPEEEGIEILDGPGSTPEEGRRTD
jgi:hypothetical protein